MQELIVTLIVACAALTVARRYLPVSARNALRGWGSDVADKLGWHGVAKRLSVPAPAAQDCGSGCGSCKSCGPAPAITDTGRHIPIKQI